MAKREEVAKKARILRACQYGEPDDVVELSDAELSAAVDAGCVDPNPAAVAYAESLKSGK